MQPALQDQLEDELITLDPHNLNNQDEGDRIRSKGRLVAVKLPGGVRAWATAHYQTARHVLGGPAWRKNPREHWGAYKRGEVPIDWPLLRLVDMENMLNADGEDHVRLRRPLSNAFTPRRVDQLRPRIEELTDSLIKQLADVPSGEAVDLRSTYAYDLPMGVICELFGLSDPSARQRLAKSYHALIDSRTTAEEAQAAEAELTEVIATLIQEKREHPGQDLTTDLISAVDDSEGSEQGLTEKELFETIFLLLFAGHETTRNLISNLLTTLMACPDQLALLRAGAVPWRQAVEEALRHYSPINTIMFRYAAEDITVPDTGVTVRKDEPVVVCVAATGRDPEQHGPQADQFDAARSSNHLSFSYGAHYCIGAALARLMAATAVEAVCMQFDMTPAPGALHPEPSFSSNTAHEVPVFLTARTVPAAA